MRWLVTITAENFGLHVYKVDAADRAGAVLVAMAQHVGKARDVCIGHHPDAVRLRKYRLRYSKVESPGPYDDTHVVSLWAPSALKAGERARQLLGDLRTLTILETKVIRDG